MTITRGNKYLELQRQVGNATSDVAILSQNTGWVSYLTGRGLWFQAQSFSVAISQAEPDPRKRGGSGILRIQDFVLALQWFGWGWAQSWWNGIRNWTESQNGGKKIWSLNLPIHELRATYSISKVQRRSRKHRSSWISVLIVSAFGSGDVVCIRYCYCVYTFCLLDGISL